MLKILMTLWIFAMSLICWVTSKGTTYFDGEYATSFISKDESETVHLFHNTFPDEELINQLKEKRDDIVTKTCTKCKKVLFKGSERAARRMIIYCVDCPKG